MGYGLSGKTVKQIGIKRWKGGGGQNMKQNLIHLSQKLTKTQWNMR